MTLNILRDSVEHYLKSIEKSQQNDRLSALLCCALLRPLCKELAQQSDPNDLQRLTDLPQGAPDWLRQAFDRGEALYRFKPSPQRQSEIRHIADWIKAALLNGEDWPKDVDAQGRPKKLRKIGSFAQAKQQADKAMRLAAQRLSARDYDEAAGERSVMAFGDGYRMVQLLTPEALDRESALLRHCIGDGAYDEELTSGTSAFYSLRDPRGKGHATLEVRAEDRALLQCKGKENAPPVAKYMPHIQAFLKRENFKLVENPCMTGLIEQAGRYYELCDLPAQFFYEGDLNLVYAKIAALPDGLTVSGGLYLIDTKITALPEGLKVGGSLYLINTKIKALPKDLKVGGSLYLLRGTKITNLPADLKVGGNIYLTDGVECRTVEDARRIIGQEGFAAPSTASAQPAL